MSKYYYLNAQNQQMGPVEKQDLIPCGVTRQTMVWTEGMASWAPAWQVPDLGDLFATVPPVQPSGPVYPTPGPGPAYPEAMQGKPQSYMWLAILSTLLCCLPFGIVSIVYASKVDSTWAIGDYPKAQEYADKAKMWGLISVGAGFLSIILVIALEMAAFL